MIRMGTCMLYVLAGALLRLVEESSGKGRRGVCA